ncbi:MAG: alpha/beta fold hydrolase [Deltaproteobacteria bacterium]|nr:alpha/beta fold hydrolase [Deltaproteobacteria bacterium]
MRVFLIHGMGRTQVSMALLARRLRAAGHHTSSYSYYVSRDPLARIAEGLVTHVERALDDGHDRQFAVIGHSLGNIVTRMALPRLQGLRRFVMLAPPNHPPVLARTLQGNPLFRALARDAGQKLSDEDFYRRLPIPTAPTLIVAGTRGPRAPWLPFAGRASDGVVGVDETRLPGVEHVEVPAIHTFIMNDAEVARLTLRFLEAGTLVESTSARE